MPSTLEKLAKYGATPINRQARNSLSYKKKPKKKKGSKGLKTKNVVSSAKADMVKCPICTSPVSARHLQRHLRKMHPPTPATGRTIGPQSINVVTATPPNVAAQNIRTRKTDPTPHYLKSALAAQERQARIREKVDKPREERIKNRYKKFLRTQSRSNELVAKGEAVTAHKRFGALITEFLKGTIDRAQLNELWTFQKELASYPEIKATLLKKLTKEEDVIVKIGAPPEKSKARKNQVCPGCGGDGGAAGACYKCDGTGWI